MDQAAFEAGDQRGAPLALESVISKSDTSLRAAEHPQTDPWRPHELRASRARSETSQSVEGTERQSQLCSRYRNGPHDDCHAQKEEGAQSQEPCGAPPESLSCRGPPRPSRPPTHPVRAPTELLGAGEFHQACAP
jgi:hypothetical protein